MQIPDGSDLPQGAGYGSFGAPRARDVIAAMIMRSFILKCDNRWCTVFRGDVGGDASQRCVEVSMSTTWYVTALVVTKPDGLYIQQNRVCDAADIAVEHNSASLHLQ